MFKSSFNFVYLTTFVQYLSTPTLSSNYLKWTSPLQSSHLIFICTIFKCLTKNHFIHKKKKLN